MLVFSAKSILDRELSIYCSALPTSCSRTLLDHPYLWISSGYANINKIRFSLETFNSVVFRLPLGMLYSRYGSLCWTQLYQDRLRSGLSRLTKDPVDRALLRMSMSNRKAAVTGMRTRWQPHGSVASNTTRHSGLTIIEGIYLGTNYLPCQHRWHYILH